MTNWVLKIDRLASLVLASLAIALLALPAKAIISKENRMSDHGNDEEDRLLAIVRDKDAQEKDREAFVQAIERLGEMRSVAAIDDLIGLVTLKKALDSKDETPPIVINMEHPVTPLSVYPATGALFYIGKPALPSLIKLIETSDPDALASQNAVYTVMAIFREDPVAGVQYLQSAADYALTVEASKNLLRAVARARTLFR